ncbi:molybdenum cofactor guanylyltransferase MobA [Halomonas sp. WWR20]
MQAEDITAVILAGGQGRRMGGRDKGWEPFMGRPLIEHVLARLTDQVGAVLINANRTQQAYRQLGYPVVSDRDAGYQGPLMGIWSGMCAVETPWTLIVPCDSPALPVTLVERLRHGTQQHDIGVAHDGQRAHPVVALMRTALRDDLGQILADGERKIDRFYARHAWCHVDFSDMPQAFSNLNSPDERDALERSMRHYP